MGMDKLVRVTEYPEIDGLLRNLREEIQRALKEKLAGLYLFGSLVMGDFDRAISDIDLLAVTTSEVDEREFAELEVMHNDFVRKYPEWNDRIEIAYVSTTALKTYKTKKSQIGIISPGEPFHMKEAGNDWLINWWMALEKGVALFGPPPTAFIEPISQEEFVSAVREQAREWREWVHTGQKRKFQAYAILTMCRALYAYENGEQASKKQAALWAMERLPEWASLIEKAVEWREAWEEEGVDHEATYAETEKFVHFVVGEIVEE